MQAVSIYLPSSAALLSVKSSPSFSSKTLLLFPKNHQSIRMSSTSVSIKASSEAAEVDYSSMASSVFPAEACETVGGVACDVDMFPETKLRDEPSKPKPKTKTSSSSSSVDREYLEYNSPKTVFISEACDDLGGEFCDPDYQTNN
uniref:light-regulated protein 1, chloroplastic n=1 Tax=Erigeron canadensis TaxID=72917 RepID=UPI001CB91F09|nr:light-regulated protein 1, chloroplastic [Erigeron canadensis]